MKLPDWNIGPTAQRHLAQMAKDGWDGQNICYMPGVSAASPRWSVKIWKDDTFCCGFGNTIGLAVAEAYEEWKGKERVCLQ